MNIIEAQNLVKDLRNQINYHNKKYYDEDAPEIEDFEYDMLLKELVKVATLGNLNIMPVWLLI